MLLKSSCLGFFSFKSCFASASHKAANVGEVFKLCVSAYGFHLIPERQTKLGQEVLAKEKDQKQH